MVGTANQDTLFLVVDMWDFLKEAIDDKTLCIVAGTIIACWSIHSMGPQAKEIVVPIVTGIFGIGTGYSMGRIHGIR